jgi:hypothetical protein
MLNYVSLQLDVVAPKVTKKYGNVYLAGGDVLKSTDVLYTQRIELSTCVIIRNLDLLTFDRLDKRIVRCLHVHSGSIVRNLLCSNITQRAVFFATFSDLWVSNQVGTAFGSTTLAGWINLDAR